MVDAKRTAALVQVVDVLGAEIKTIAQPLFDLRQGQVCGIRLRSESIAAAHGIETPHQFRIGVPRLGRCDLVHSIAVPQPSGAPEGSKSALRGNTGASENEEPVMRGQNHDQMS